MPLLRHWSERQWQRAKVRRPREDWFAHRLPAIARTPERVVFLDETAVKTNLTRLRGWALRGERLKADAPFGSWGTQTLIAGLTVDALIAPWVIKGAMDGPACATYVREGPIPEIAPGPVVGPLTRTVAYGYSDRWRNLGDRSGPPSSTPWPPTAPKRPPPSRRMGAGSFTCRRIRLI